MWTHWFWGINRSSRPEVFCKKGAVKNFSKFIGKHLCQNLFFNKVVKLTPTTLLKKSLWHRCFPMNFAQVLRTPFLIEHLWWLLLNQSHWFAKQELVERHEPNICNVVHCFLWHQSSFLEIYFMKQAKLEDLPNHGSFWQLLLILHTISIALLNDLYLNYIWLFQLLHAD